MAGSLNQRALPGFDNAPGKQSGPLHDGDSSSESPELSPKENQAVVAGNAVVAGKTVYVVDSFALIFQVFHAMGEMVGPAGQPVQALYGFVRDILYLVQEKNPDFLICAFDSPGPTFRHELFDQYKINREEMPQDLQEQIPQIKRFLSAMRIPILEIASYEADDILATLAKTVDNSGGKCVLVTHDKDCRQLISENVSLYNIRKNRFLDPQGLLDDWGIRPDQVVDFQSLVGDSVDNIPGIPLIGPKIAGQLLKEFGTLESILEKTDQISGTKRKQNLVEGRQQALLSRELVKLKDDVPVALDWHDADVGKIDRRSAGPLFQEWGFRRFAQMARGEGESADSAKWQARYVTVSSIDQLAKLVEEIKTTSRVSVDTETTSINPRWAQLVGISFSWKVGEAYYVPIRAPRGDPCLDLKSVLEVLRTVLEDPATEKIGQNLKYDLIVLRAAGVRMAGIAFDTMVASYLLDAGARNHNLDELSQRYLDHQTTKISDLIGTGRHQKRMDEVPVEKVSDYAAEDADIPLRLQPILGARLESENLDSLFADLEMPLIEVLGELEFNGVRVDTNRLAELSQRYGEHMRTLESEIHELAGRAFNIGSPKQLAAVLFDELNLPIIKKTKTGPSTDADVLEQLAVTHPLPAKVIQYRQYSKLKGTYVDALPKLVHPETGRIHTSFNQVVAATGRLSSVDPNLQNIPIRTETSREIRSAFVPGQAGWVLLTADYSQIELRVLAHFSADATLRAAFVNDEDIHARVASEVYRVPTDQVTGEMRRQAKAINFGIIYGQSPFGLAKALGIDQDEAADFIDAYFGQYPGVERFFETILDECRQNGYVRTILGRRRKIQGVRSPSQRGDSRQRNLPERTAINTVIQGSAADLIKLAMVNLYRRLGKEQIEARMLLQIHDELVFEIPSHQKDVLAQIVSAEMSCVGELSVPLKVDVKSGENWADCEPMP